MKCAACEQNEKSDIDILVEFKEPVGFLSIHLAPKSKKHGQRGCYLSKRNGYTWQPCPCCSNYQ